MIYESLYIKARESDLRSVVNEIARRHNMIVEEGYGGNVLTIRPGKRRMLIFSPPRDLYYLNIIILHRDDDILHVIFRIRESEYSMGMKFYHEIRSRFIGIS